MIVRKSENWEEDVASSRRETEEVAGGRWNDDPAAVFDRLEGRVPTGTRLTEDGGQSVLETVETPVSVEEAPEGCAFVCPHCEADNWVQPPLYGALVACHQCDEALVAPDPGNGRGPLPFRAILERIDPRQPECRIQDGIGGPFDWETATAIGADAVAAGGLCPTLIDAPGAPAFSGNPEAIAAREREESLLHRKPQAAIRVATTGSEACGERDEKPTSLHTSGVRWPALAAGAVAILAIGVWTLTHHFAKQSGTSLTRTPATRDVAQPTPLPQAEPPADPEKRPVEASTAGGLPAKASSHSTVEGESSPAAPTAGADPRVALFESARKAVDGFFLAETPEQRLQWQHGRRTPPTNLPSGRLEIKEVRHLFTGRAESRENGPLFTEFRVSLTDREGSLWIPFEHTPEGPRTDAHLLREQLEQSLEKFAAHQAGDEAVLRITLSRQHSFERTAPDSEKFGCVKLLPPLGDGEGVKAYFENGLLAGDAIARDLPWGKTLHAVAQLEWSPAAPAAGAPHPFLRLREIVRWGW